MLSSVVDIAGELISYLVMFLNGIAAQFM